MRLFISFCRSKDRGHAARLANTLRGKGRAVVIRPEVDARRPEGARAAIESCDATIVVIGREWLDCLRATDGATSSRDPGYTEACAAATSLRPVIPVLVEGASMPTAEDIPEAIRRLALLQAHELDDARWEATVADLMAGIEAVMPSEKTLRASSLLDSPHWTWRGVATVDAHRAFLASREALTGMENELGRGEVVAREDSRIVFKGRYPRHTASIQELRIEISAISAHEALLNVATRRLHTGGLDLLVPRSTRRLLLAFVEQLETKAPLRQAELSG